jgi:hypothetical protein
MYLATRIEPADATRGIAATIHTVCHCPGDHIVEIEGTDGMSIDAGFEDKEIIRHTEEGTMKQQFWKRPVNPIDRITIVADKLTKGAWADSCSVHRTREFFPEHPADTLCWVIKVRMP